MKPTKNRIYCGEFGRVKMLFDTESKADNFIRFNSKDIIDKNGKTPVRSYYCKVCGGWHVTSKESFDEEKYGLVDKVVSVYNMSTSTRKPYHSNMSQIDLMLLQAKRQLAKKEYEECKNTLGLVKNGIDDLPSYCKEQKQFEEFLIRYKKYDLELERKTKNEDVMSVTNRIIIYLEKAEALVNENKLAECEAVINEIVYHLDKSELFPGKNKAYKKLQAIKTMLNIKKGTEYILAMDQPCSHIIVTSLSDLYRTIQLNCLYNEYQECVPLLQKAYQMYSILKRSSNNETTINKLEKDLKYYIEFVKSKMEAAQ